MLLKEIEDRCSIRTFSTKKIADADMHEILEAGRLAPSWMNVQPWHFIVTDKQEHKNFLSKCANFQKQIKEASHIIIILGDLTAWNHTKFSKILQEKGLEKDGIAHLLNDKGYNPAKHSSQMVVLRTIEQCAYAISFMQLQARHLGIDSCIIGALTNELTGFNPELLQEFRETFNVPEGMLIAGLLALGYRKEGVKTPLKLRKNFENIISIEEYSHE